MLILEEEALNIDLDVVVVLELEQCLAKEAHARGDLRRDEKIQVAEREFVLVLTAATRRIPVTEGIVHVSETTHGQIGKGKLIGFAGWNVLRWVKDVLVGGRQ